MTALEAVVKPGLVNCNFSWSSQFCVPHVPHSCAVYPPRPSHTTPASVGSSAAMKLGMLVAPGKKRKRAGALVAVTCDCGMYYCHSLLYDKLSSLRSHNAGLQQVWARSGAHSYQTCFCHCDLRVSCGSVPHLPSNPTEQGSAAHRV